LIGINYIGQQCELEGCVNDIHNMRTFISQRFGFPTDAEHMQTLTDDGSGNDLPTKYNILRYISWLITGAQPGDSLFLHYSGHGSVAEDQLGLGKSTGKEDTICPLDRDSAGDILDEELHNAVVKPLARGVKLTAIFDCCHSGSALNLPFSYHHNVQPKENKHLDQDRSPADVVLFAGCKDDQTSSDSTFAGYGHAGALTWGFISNLKSHREGLSYVELLTDIRESIKNDRLTQVPQLSSGHKMELRAAEFLI